MKFKLKIIKDCICYWGWQFFTIRPLFCMFQVLDQYQYHFLEGNASIGMVIAPDTKNKEIWFLPKYKLHYMSGSDMHGPRFYFDEYPKPLGKCYDIEDFFYQKLTTTYHIEKQFNTFKELCPVSKME